MASNAVDILSDRYYLDDFIGLLLDFDLMEEKLKKYEVISLIFFSSFSSSSRTRKNIEASL